MNALAFQAEVPEAATSHLPIDAGAERAPLGNCLLSRLPSSEFMRLRGHLQPAWLLAGETVPLEGHGLLFPVQAILSLQTVLSDGYTVAFASIGREGCLGRSTAPGSHKEARRCVVHAGGLAYRLPAELVADFAGGPGQLQSLLVAHERALLGQAAILCGCYRRHTLEQQLARWLLLTLDRLPGTEILVTQEMIAGVLGVRREGVTEAARRLQRDGLIHYRRGHVFVLDRDALAGRACECYAAIRAEFARLRS